LLTHAPLFAGHGKQGVKFSRMDATFRAEMLACLRFADAIAAVGATLSALPKIKWE
jgi:hypothetical protein